MEKKSSERPTISRPKDSSLEAYKEWVRELANRYTNHNQDVNLTEEEWVAHWKEYWREKSGH